MISPTPGGGELWRRQPTLSFERRVFRRCPVLAGNNKGIFVYIWASSRDMGIFGGGSHLAQDAQLALISWLGKTGIFEGFFDGRCAHQPPSLGFYIRIQISPSACCGAMTFAAICLDEPENEFRFEP